MGRRGRERSLEPLDILKWRETRPPPTRLSPPRTVAHGGLYRYRVLFGHRAFSWEVYDSLAAAPLQLRKPRNV